MKVLTIALLNAVCGAAGAAACPVNSQGQLADFVFGQQAVGARAAGD